MNAPTHLCDRAMWESFAPDGHTHVGYAFDVLTDETRAQYAGYGDVLVEQWSVYRTADGGQIFSVNPDGTLRYMREYIAPAA